jgi:hypothetical protein
VENGPQEVCDCRSSVDLFLTDFDQINVLSWMTRTALEIIGQTGFGYSFDPLAEDGNDHIFSKSVKELMYALDWTLLISRTKYIF